MPAEPVAHAPNVTPFDLEGLADLARKVSPEIAANVDTEVGAPTTPAPEPDPAPPEEVEPAPADEPEAKAPDEPAAKEPDSDAPLADELEELNRQSAAAKAKTAPKPADKPVETKPEPAPVNERDKDLQLDPRTSAVLHPRTKKIIEERNQRIAEARDKADVLAKEKAELEKQLAEARKVVVPKETEEELKTLREQIRELDITKDPSIRREFDEPIAKNGDKIVEILKGFGLGKTVDGKDDPDAVEALKKAGLTFSTLAPQIKKLSDAGEEGAAEELREFLRENIRLGRAKEAKIGEWKTNYAAKQQHVQQQSQQHQQEIVAKVQDHAKRILDSDIASLSKDFPFLNRPAEPLPTDAPAVAKSKQDAIAAYDAAAKSIGEAVASLDASKAPPEKVAEIHGKMSATAVQGIIIRQHILPRLAKELAELRAQNTELKAKDSKLRAANTLSRTHAAAASAPAGTKAPLPDSMEDAAKQVAKDMGIAIE